MIKALKILSGIIVLMMSMQVYGQNKKDSTYLSNKVYYDAISNYPFDSSKLRRVDTTLNNFNLTDLIFNYDYFYNSIGNIGLSHRNLLFSPNIHAGFKYGYDCFQQYILTDTNTYCYKSERPYTNIEYTNSPGNERIEEAAYLQHNQKLGKTITFGTNFFFINSKGFYVNEHVMVANFDINLRFRTINQRYGFMLAYFHSRINNEENGGMTDDTEFTDNKLINRKVIDVALDNASNLVKTGGWYFSQDYYFFKRDSLHLNKTLKLIHKVNIQRDRRVYEDDSPDTLYYYNFYGYLAKIYDSTSVRSICNTFAISDFDFYNHNMMQFELGMKLNYYKVGYNYLTTSVRNDTSFSSTVTNIMPYAKFKFNFQALTFVPEVTFSLGNHNLGDYEIKATASTHIRKFNFSASYLTSGIDVPWMYKRMYSSLFQWDKSFSKMFSNNLNISAAYKYFQLDVKYSLINNYVYLDEKITPQVTGHAISYLSADIGGYIDFWKFTVGGRFVYQDVSDKDIVRVPDFMCKLKLAYHQYLFKKKLLSEIGLDCIYNTSFYAEAYMPAIRSFYLQNEVKTGNFPYMNLYIKMQVKRARIFVELVNATEGLTDYNYISVPHYPLNDRQIRIGLSWYFHD